MRETRRSTPGFAWAWLALVLLPAMAPATASAQTAHRTWAVVPLLGFGVGVLRDNGSWGSAGMEAAVDVEYGGIAWRGNGYASLRGMGVSCSHGGCFEGGPAVALGGARSVGSFWIGAGAGVMKQLGEWRLLPYGRISLDRAPFRVDLRVELPQGSDVGVYVPILIGIPISR